MYTLFFLDTGILPEVRLLCHVDYQQPWLHFTRCIDEYILYYIISGELFIKEDNREYSLYTGDYLILEPNIVHTGFKPSCCHYFYVHFKDEGILRLDSQDEDRLIDKMTEDRKKSIESDIYLSYQDVEKYCYLPKNNHINPGSEIVQMFFRANYDFYTKLEHYRSSVACQLLDILIKLGREFASDQISRGESSLPRVYARINEIKNFILTRHKQKITSGIIETEFGMSYDYLNKVFHKITGYSIFNYLNMVRISKARELIEVSDMKYAEISYSVGIEDPFYFSKLFKKYTGLSPSQYWQRHNKLSCGNEIQQDEFLKGE